MGKTVLSYLTKIYLNTIGILWKKGKAMEEFYKQEDLKDLLKPNTQQWVKDIFTSIKEWNEDEEIYFFHAVFRVTKEGQSRYYDYIGHKCENDTNQEKLLAYLNATLNYFVQYGTTINTPLPNGRKRAGVAHIEATDENSPNICCQDSNSTINESDIQKIDHTNAFTYESVIQDERSSQPGDYITGCLRVDLKQDCKEVCQCCGLKFLSVSSGGIFNDESFEESINCYGKGGYIDQDKENQTLIKDESYYGFGASIFYVTDNTKDVSEEFVKDVMAILNVEMLKDLVETHSELKSIKQQLEDKNKRLEEFLKNLSAGAKGLVDEIDKTKLYLNDDARNFIERVSSDGFNDIFRGAKHIYDEKNIKEQEGALKELFKFNEEGLWRCKKVQGENFWEGKLNNDSFEAIKGLRDLRGKETELPVDTLLWLFLDEPKCSGEFGAKTSDRKVACTPKQAEMFIKGVMLLADQPKEDLEYTIEKKDQKTVITFRAKEGGDMEKLFNMVKSNDETANEGYHLNTFILRSLVAKEKENDKEVGEIQYNEDKGTITITYDFEAGGEQ